MSAYQQLRMYLREPVSIEWEVWRLFGIAMQIPVLRFIIRKSEEHRTEFNKFSAEMSTCAACHTLTSHHRGVKLIMHLQREHGLNEDRAISIVEDLWKEVFILKPRRKPFYE